MEAGASFTLHHTTPRTFPLVDPELDQRRSVDVIAYASRSAVLDIVRTYWPSTTSRTLPSTGRPILKCSPSAPVVTTASHNPTRMVCYFDGACPGNQFAQKGPMKAAFVIEDNKFVRDVPDLPTPDGPMRSNNIAEYHGLLFLLRHLHELDRQRGSKGSYLVCGDSELVVRQMRGDYRVRTPHLAPLHDEALRLSADLDAEFREIPRGQNRAGFLLEERRR